MTPLWTDRTAADGGLARAHRVANSCTNHGSATPAKTVLIIRKRYQMSYLLASNFKSARLRSNTRRLVRGRLSCGLYRAAFSLRRISVHNNNSKAKPFPDCLHAQA